MKKLKTLEMKKLKTLAIFIPESVPNHDEPFIAKNYFVISACSEAKPRICYMNEEFRRLFLPFIEEMKTDDGPLYVGKLLRKFCDSIIVDAEGFRSVRLYDVYWAISQQGRGEKGVLHTKRFSWKANIFHIKDLDGFSHFIFVSYDKKKDGWSIVSRTVDFFSDQKSLSKGSHLFCRIF